MPIFIFFSAWYRQTCYSMLRFYRNTCLWMKKLSKGFYIFLDFFFPEFCRLCSKAVYQGRCICTECEAKLPRIDDHRCEKCGDMLISEQRLCLRCRQTNFPFIRNTAIFKYQGDLRHLLLLYKLERDENLAFFWAQELAAAYQKLGFNNIPILPIASGKKKKWDPMYKIAHLLKTQYRLPVIFAFKMKKKLSQKSLNYAERLKNIAGKVTVDRSQLPQSMDTVILVDDIFTTGATVQECTRMLHQLKILNVLVLTIALD